MTFLPTNLILGNNLHTKFRLQFNICVLICFFSSGEQVSEDETAGGTICGAPMFGGRRGDIRSDKVKTKHQAELISSSRKLIKVDILRFTLLSHFFIALFSLDIIM